MQKLSRCKIALSYSALVSIKISATAATHKIEVHFYRESTVASIATIMPQAYVNVWVYGIGSRGKKKHTALEIQTAEFRICIEAALRRFFSCNICDNGEWYLNKAMKQHFESEHADQRCFETHNHERFVREAFKTKQAMSWNAFQQMENTLCSGVVFESSHRLGTIEITKERFSTLVSKWEVGLNNRAYDPIANNCNHQVEKWCQDLGVKAPPSSVNLLAKLAYALYGPMHSD